MEERILGEVFVVQITKEIFLHCTKTEDFHYGFLQKIHMIFVASEPFLIE